MKHRILHHAKLATLCLFLLFAVCRAAGLEAGSRKLKTTFCTASVQGNSQCGQGRCCSMEGYCQDNPLGPDADPDTCTQYGVAKPVGSLCYYDIDCDPGLTCFEGVCNDTSVFGK